MFSSDFNTSITMIIVIFIVNVLPGSAEVGNDWSGGTSGFYGRYFQKEAQKDYRLSSGVLLKIEVGIR